MAKPSPKPPARKAGARPAAAGSRGTVRSGSSVGRGQPTAGPVVSRVKTAARPAKPGHSSRAGKPPDDVVAKGRVRSGPPRGSEKAPARKPLAGSPSGKARAGQPLFARTPNEEGPSPAVPSSLTVNRRASAARTGRAELQERYRNHTETGPGVTGGDVDADWESAYTVGDEAPGGDNPTPGQTVVEDVGRALGVEYQDEEELKAVDKIESRDRHRWELDPASSEDYQERMKTAKTPRRQSKVKGR